MSVVKLEKYNPQPIASEYSDIITFIFPMSHARDVLLADLGTELSNSNNVVYYNGHYYTCDGVDKFFQEESGIWYARILSARLMR